MFCGQTWENSIIFKNTFTWYYILPWKTMFHSRDSPRLLVCDTGLYLEQNDICFITVAICGGYISKYPGLMVCYDMMWCDSMWSDVMWNDMIWYDMILRDFNSRIFYIFHQFSTVGYPVWYTSAGHIIIDLSYDLCPRTSHSGLTIHQTSPASWADMCIHNTEYRELPPWCQL